MGAEKGLRRYNGSDNNGCPLDVEVDAIKDIKVFETIKDGKTIYKRK